MAVTLESTLQQEPQTARATRAVVAATVTMDAAREKISAYLELSKSGIVTLVLISVLGGYLVGQPAEVTLSWTRMATTLIGVLFLASGSSALNQLQEIAEDSKMPRTANRPLPSGRISTAGAWTFTVFGISVGLLILGALDWMLLALGVAAVLSYNGLYTLWWKRRWSYAAVPGAIPGALPVLMGHLAASGHLLAPGGVFLFALLFFWQMPHFWVLALKYRNDYQSGAFPTLPVTHGPGVTVERIVMWCLAYVGIAILAPLFLAVGGLYCIPTFALSMKVLWELRKFIRQPESKHWLHFFLWVNFSLIGYIAFAAMDLWSVYLIRYFTK